MKRSVHALAEKYAERVSEIAVVRLGIVKPERIQIVYLAAKHAIQSALHADRRYSRIYRAKKKTEF